MTTRSSPQRPLAELLYELQIAVQNGDRSRAEQLEQVILQRLAAEAAERAELEIQVRDLMAQLDRPEAGSGFRGTGPTRAERERPKKGFRSRDRDQPGSGAEPIEELGRSSGEDSFGIELERAEPRTRSISRDSYGVAREGPPVEAPPAEADGVVYPVWFGTNRKPAAGDEGFSGERHDRVTRGRVDVHVPQAHRFGETGTSFWQRLARRDLRDDRLRLRSLERLERDAFFSEIREAMERARESGEAPHALFFLHGFNVSFEEAAIRAAQIGYDLKVPGATAFFSWPSRGSVVAYTADEASIEASERAITDFLVDFAAHCGAEKVHVLAHSMGNRGLLRALQRIAADAETRGKVKLGQIFLAAPDVDRDLFLDLARLYPEHAERTTLYASGRDLPVHLSAKVHDAPRAGYFVPYCVAPGVDTIAVPDFDVDLLGHSYFAQAEALLHDIYDLMRHGEAPGKRQRLQSALYEGAAYWQLER